MRSLLARLAAPARDMLRRLRYAEPAVLKARWTQLCGLALSLGLTLPGWLNSYAGWALAVFTVAAPWLQGRRTRADVWSQATVDELTDLVARFPGLEREAKDLLQQGLSFWVVFGELEELAHGPHGPGVTPAVAQ